MSDYLLQLALGPVQDFIAAARRTRDLWFGSHLLSEISKAAAKSLADAGAELIFPALERDAAELEPCDAPFNEATGQPAYNVGNKVLAIVSDGMDPEALAREARTAAQARLVELANIARGQANGLIAQGSQVSDDWDEQVATALEFVAAWVPTTKATYAADREQVDQAIAARKNLREFPRWHAARPGAPKSSLDGERTSVLKEPRDRPAWLVRKYRLGTNEQLDAIGVLKRCGGEPEQFVPLQNVALGAWVAAAKRHKPDLFEVLIQQCRAEAADREGWRGLPQVLTKTPVAQQFPYDAYVLMRSRWAPLAAELFVDDGSTAPGSSVGDQRPELPGELQKAVRALTETCGDPPAYVCCLVADGDHMGLTLNGLPEPDQHRTFSQTLAGFAPEAREIIERHLGAVVFVGGDDVLAFLPVATAVTAANELRTVFSTKLAPFKAQAGHAPTLSVGLAIGHVLTGMGELLELGRRAERLAKEERNSLAILLEKRSGGADQWAVPWTSDPARTVTEAAGRLSTCLSVGKVHEIRDRLLVCPEPEGLSADEATAWAHVLRGEVYRILSRNERGLGDSPTNLRPANFGLLLSPAADYTLLYGQVRDWLALQRVALAVHAATPKGTQADGDAPEGEEGECDA